MSIDETPQYFRRIWEGDTKIVIGIDIGPTKSGVAFAFLENGAYQDIHRVTHWPGQEAHNQQGRIPTLIWYDTNSKAVAFGAEALLPTIEEEAEDNGWVLAKHFKLHLHPTEMQQRHCIRLDPLPSKVTLHQIYSDFLGYLAKHTRSYFEDRIPEGKQIWEQYSPMMEVVIAHPNGWGIREQAFLRSVAVDAGFSTAEKASRNIRFVTEAEASVHFCIYHTNLEVVLQPGANFAVCDAGDSTIETIVYSVISTFPVLKFREKRASVCVRAGGMFVDFEVEKFLRRTLASAGIDSEDVLNYTKEGVKDFERFAKRTFQDKASDLSVFIGNTRFNNTAIRVRRGHITLSGSTVKGFFDVCIKEITSSVDKQLDNLNVPYLLLVGGFGESPYLRQEFKKRYEPRGCQVTLTNDSSSKAVSDGAVIWAVANDLLSHLPRLSWGIETSVTFDPNDPDHLQRKAISSTSAWTTVPGRWKCLIQKGILPDEHSIAKIPFSLEFPSSPTELGEFNLDLYGYSGDDEPLWMKDEQGCLLPNFRQVAIIQTSLENLYGALETCITSGGILQRQLDFDVCVEFGGEELEVYLEWEEKGFRRKVPIKCVPSSG